jgi:RluA family pseudouridine synthase
VQPKLPRANDPAGEPLALTSRVPRDAAGRSLIDWLAGRFRYLDRAQWEALVAAGDVSVGEAAATVATRLRGGERVTTRLHRREPDVDDRIEILHVDPELVVATKPALLPMHADGPFVRHTFASLLEQRLGPPRPRLVHRLDRETSGVVVAARTRAAATTLEVAFRTGAVHKEYVAILHGAVAPDRITIELPIGRAKDSRISMRHGVRDPGDPAGRPAVTELIVVARAAAHTWVRLLPRTGRTHQVRVHCEALGHPVAGDKLYGRSDDDWLEYVAYVKAGGDQGFGGRLDVARHLLHATRLELPHPTEGRRLAFTSGPPEEFARYWREVAGGA